MYTPAINRRLLFCLVLTLLFTAGAEAETFVYKYQKGNKYRILSVVDQDVYITRPSEARRLDHRARTLNKISVEITGLEGNRARHNALFITLEQGEGEGESFHWTREYPSVFDRDRLGYISIGPEYFMPMVRDVPVFPDKNIREGETWTAPGHEVHDFRDAFGIEEPYRIPFEAQYTFLGSGEWKNRTYPVFSISYHISYEPPPAAGHVYPRKIRGVLDQRVYWDNEIGQPAAYTETFEMVFEMSNGFIFEFQGRAEAEIIESEIMNREETAKTIADEIEKLGITDASVRVVEEGVTISLENIQFQADSSVLLPGEKVKLDKLGEILGRYGDRDILVGGHTAMAGTAAGRQRLSLERASSVSNYLISRGVRTASRIMVRGYGAERPLADNKTPEGMARNRRVEITILEN
ncbi:MAG: OmpA family protein [Treponema sp.]|jgi:outer membrane protein OmpA-like peptidoglycan-associated protein|nr:OmpA family protein [Treponema sp.]